MINSLVVIGIAAAGSGVWGLALARWLRGAQIIPWRERSPVGWPVELPLLAFPVWLLVALLVQAAVQAGGELTLLQSIQLGCVTRGLAWAAVLTLCRSFAATTLADLGLPREGWLRDCSLGWQSRPPFCQSCWP